MLSRLSQDGPIAMGLVALAIGGFSLLSGAVTGPGLIWVLIGLGLLCWGSAVRANSSSPQRATAWRVGAVICWLLILVVGIASWGQL